MGRRGERLPGEVLARAECVALLEACDLDPVGLRNRALLALLWRAGLRCFEALSLRPADLDLARGLVHVRRGKGGTPRRAGLDPEACEIVGIWLDERAALALGDGETPVLCNVRTGRGLTTAFVRSLVARLARKAGISHRVHPHALRHSWAVQALEDGLSLPFVQAQLGHRDLATTGIYLRHVAPEALAEAASRRPSWRR